MIDWNRVIELRDEVGPSEFDPVLELFVDEVEEIVMRLSKDDPGKLERDLHFLKGSAWNLGFAEFGSLCQEFEAKVCRGQIETIQIDRIVRCYSTSKQVFMRDLPRIIDDQEGGAAGVA
ncbi:Hpt domain-containing protein [Paracoccus sp. M683]|uniref:Hpt domain-containing protein n=1 Tax=Paracoccus sp. M683 TaxID=2594268 RepID=UPI00117D8144|nr:Hpt domain-containing protein [Paracoccus sp. M683]TRW99289.1 Hpt domain-containing protein [Paracoccus sp. M683]